MKIIEKENEIILRDIPFATWFFGIFLTLFFLVVSYLIVSDAIKFPISTFSLGKGVFSILFDILWFLFIAAVMCSCLYMFAKQTLTPMFKVYVRPNLQTIDIISRRLFFFKNHQRFYFSQVKEFALIRREENDKFSYFAVLKLINNDEIDLESSGSVTSHNAYKIAQLNKLIKEHNPKNKGKTARAKQRKTKRQMKESEK